MLVQIILYIIEIICGTSVLRWFMFGFWCCLCGLNVKIAFDLISKKNKLRLQQVIKSLSEKAKSVETAETAETAEIV